MNNDVCKCELCGKKVDEEKAIYFYNDLEVNPDYEEYNKVYCKSCVIENFLA